jgi:hypothetical protein
MHIPQQIANTKYSYNVHICAVNQCPVKFWIVIVLCHQLTIHNTKGLHKETLKPAKWINIFRYHMVTVSTTRKTTALCTLLPKIMEPRTACKYITKWQHYNWHPYKPSTFSRHTLPTDEQHTTLQPPSLSTVGHTNHNTPHGDTYCIDRSCEEEDKPGRHEPHL